MRLTQLDLQTEYRSDIDNMVHDFLEPCLRHASLYRRAVGYFTSDGLASAARGLGSFVESGGTMRLIASPLLNAEDYEAIRRGEKAKADAIEMSLLREIVNLLDATDVDSLGLLAWLIAEDKLEIRLAIPISNVGEYRHGIYHEKIGIFSDNEGEAVAFTGSPNETRGGLISNFESIDVFWSWDDPHERVARKQGNFDRLWANKTSGLSILSLPDVVRKKLLEFRGGSNKKGTNAVADEAYRFSSGLWHHQREAVDAFVERRRGILEMATGTGKTRTSLAIVERLLDKGDIRTIVIAADGRDLLNQWGVDVLTLGKAQSPPLLIYRHYDVYKELDEFLIGAKDSILLVSRQFLPRALKRLENQIQAKTLLIHDEVHSLGSPSNRANLQGLSDPIPYRLGLSATPDREYDEDGNRFIEEEIGPIVYRYDLASAIRDKILAPFDYYPLPYFPNEQDRKRISNVYRKVAARKRDGNPMSKAEIWTSLATVYKTSREKLPVFANFLEQQPNLLDRCIIFVETMEYGTDVLKIVHRYKPNFHTYFGGEDQDVLHRFASGDLECLLTCHRLSEGIDIQSLRNVILFSSSRARLETIQRIGRCLRIDPRDPGKRAGIVDFIRADHDGPSDEDEHVPTDLMRSAWLTELSRITMGS